MKKQFKYLVTYDIKDNKRRSQVACELEGYGQRIQYSVFECYFSEKALKDLISRIEEIISEDDNIRFYPIEKIPEEEVIELGKAKQKLKDFFII